MGTYEKLAASANNERQLSISKLMEIDGIAQKTAEAMYEIDIHSYADLTQYLSQHTPQEISASLKAHGVNRPPTFIDKETWAKQAEQFTQLDAARELSISKLMEIDGIAQKTAGAMVDIGIHSYADLIDYLNRHTAQEVSVALKTRGVNRSPAFINKKTWIKQAKRFSELEAAREHSSSKSIEIDGVEATVELDLHNYADLVQYMNQSIARQVSVALKEHGLDRPTAPKDQEIWTSQEAPSSPRAREHDALFTLSFDVIRDDGNEPVLHTVVHDNINGGIEEVFRGSDTAGWVNWILERANLPFAPEHMVRQAEVTGEPSPTETTTAVSPTPTGLYDAQLEIVDVQLSVIEPTPEFLEKRLKAEVNFQLSGTDAEMLTSQGLHFRIEGYTLDLESGVPELVAIGRSQLEPQVFKYRREQEFAIPEVGHFEFHNIILVLPPGGMLAYHRGPIMRIVS